MGMFGLRRTGGTRWVGRRVGSEGTLGRGKSSEDAEGLGRRKGQRDSYQEDIGTEVDSGSVRLHGERSSAASTDSRSTAGLVTTFSSVSGATGSERGSDRFPDSGRVGSTHSDGKAYVGTRRSSLLPNGHAGMPVDRNARFSRSKTVNSMAEEPEGDRRREKRESNPLKGWRRGSKPTGSEYESLSSGEFDPVIAARVRANLAALLFHTDPGWSSRGKTEEDAEQVAQQIEEAMAEMVGRQTSEAYDEKYETLIRAFRDKKNAKLRADVLCGVIPARKLVKMSDFSLLNPEVKNQLRQAKREHLMLKQELESSELVRIWKQRGILPGGVDDVQVVSPPDGGDEALFIEIELNDDGSGLYKEPEQGDVPHFASFPSSGATVTDDVMNLRRNSAMNVRSAFEYLNTSLRETSSMTIIQ
uniref:TFIIS central domain-containing protein n=1 Tax=Compsopogon caeruleus TaxID=31354 RepID=A0A6T6BWM9_9RHOD